MDTCLSFPFNGVLRSKPRAKQETKDEDMSGIFNQALPRISLFGDFQKLLGCVWMLRIQTHLINRKEYLCAASKELITVKRGLRRTRVCSRNTVTTFGIEDIDVPHQNISASNDFQFQNSVYSFRSFHLLQRTPCTAGGIIQHFFNGRGCAGNTAKMNLRMINRYGGVQHRHILNVGSANVMPE